MRRQILYHTSNYAQTQGKTVNHWLSSRVFVLERVNLGAPLQCQVLNSVLVQATA